jgi:hypothetical protein
MRDVHAGERAGDGALATVVELLQRGGDGLDQEPSRPLATARLIAVGAAGLFLFGAANGLAQGGAQVALAAIKLTLVGAFAFALCAPSLLVLTTLDGASFGPRAFFQLLARGWAVSGVALAALAPIAFLFATSSRYLGSVVLAATSFSVCAALLTRRLLRTAGIGGTAAGFWVALLLVVSWQAATLARPVLVRAAAEPLWGFERRSFLEQLGQATRVRLDVSPSSTEP